MTGRSSETRERPLNPTCKKSRENLVVALQILKEAIRYVIVE
jgi:hypothetical protein